MAKGKETVLTEDAFLVSETDEKGNIIFANDEFCKIAEYEKSELLGSPHNIIRHKDMPRAAFKDLWDTIKSGVMWQGYVKNQTKSAGFYWVYATVYPYKNDKKEQCYISIRRKPSTEDIEKHEILYKTMN